MYHIGRQTWLHEVFIFASRIYLSMRPSTTANTLSVFPVISWHGLWSLESCEAIFHEKTFDQQNLIYKLMLNRDSQISFLTLTNYESKSKINVIVFADRHYYVVTTLPEFILKTSLNNIYISKTWSL